MKIGLRLISMFLFILFLTVLPYSIYYLLAANVDMPEEIAEGIG